MKMLRARAADPASVLSSRFAELSASLVIVYKPMPADAANGTIVITRNQNRSLFRRLPPGRNLLMMLMTFPPGIDIVDKLLRVLLRRIEIETKILQSALRSGTVPHFAWHPYVTTQLNSTIPFSMRIRILSSIFVQRHIIMPH
jgi:hypothetical protein